MQAQGVTGVPNWAAARESAARLREMPAQQAEANVQSQLHSILQALFPRLPASELSLERPSGDGRIDVYCRNVVFETKAQGKLDARQKPDGSRETPEEQAVRYLDALTAQPDLFTRQGIGWRAAVTDGREWHFYDYEREATAGRPLTPVGQLNLRQPEDDHALVSFLYEFVDRRVKLSPPTDDQKWAEEQAQPFIDIAARVGGAHTPAYAVKRALWRDVLQGAHITPPDDDAAERDLFARHTMLVVIARAVAETILPASGQPSDRDRLHRTLSEGFAAWLLDAAGAAGEELLDAITAEVNRYDWQSDSRDTLKDLYHAIIPRHIRHDFGEYYTPDWLARAVCEEVMDVKWRREVVELAVTLAVAGEMPGPAVLDPSCGSGTFLYHATQLLLEEAKNHPKLSGQPLHQVEIVNELVAGIDLHPVAVELAKTTKVLAFAELAGYIRDSDALNVFLGDSLQWETHRNQSLFELGELVTIPTDNPNAPLQLPRTFLLSDQFLPHLHRIFEYAHLPEEPHTEANLLAALALNTEADKAAILEVYHRIRGYIAEGRDDVWSWYISNLVQPYRLAQQPASRLVGNPPWVVYNAMTGERQNAFRQQAQDRQLWASANLATQNDIAATFVATCVDYYLAPGGKFGFVMPYAALRARQWEPFRTGVWSLPQASGRQPTLVDLSQDAWDFFNLKAPPFPQANSSAVFGNKLSQRRRRGRKVEAIPLSEIRQVSSDELVTPKMAWDEVAPKLTFSRQVGHITAPSEAYADAFRNGATLFPQPLVVFDQAQSWGLGQVHFRTNRGKGAWNGQQRNGPVEERFVKPALFSRNLLPFGIDGLPNIVAPFSADGTELEDTLPQGNDARRFRLYWDSADRAWRANRAVRPPYSLLEQIDYQGKLSSQLGNRNQHKVVYQRSGAWLVSCVVPAQIIADGTLNWFSSGDENELHYLAAIFNAPALAEFFKDYCRASDRHFQMAPVQNLPIPKFNARRRRHTDLAAQSAAAHARVAALAAERRKLTRNDVLSDAAMQPILAAIDAAVRAILPDYCA